MNVYVASQLPTQGPRRCPHLLPDGHLEDYMDVDPQWRSIGAMGTEGSEGATPSDDVPESWGWTLVDVTLLGAAVQTHLT